MREICQSGSMSGNRKQSYAQPDCGGPCESTPTATGRLKPLRLFSTLLAISPITPLRKAKKRPPRKLSGLFQNGLPFAFEPPTESVANCSGVGYECAIVREQSARSDRCRIEEPGIKRQLLEVISKAIGPRFCSKI